jgi:hypothetical protein
MISRAVVIASPFLGLEVCNAATPQQRRETMLLEISGGAIEAEPDRFVLLSAKV